MTSSASSIGSGYDSVPGCSGHVTSVLTSPWVTTSFFSCHNASHGVKHLFGWSISVWAIQGSHWGPDDARQHRGQSLSPSVSLGGFWCPLHTYSVYGKDYKQYLEIWGALVRSQTVPWYLNFPKVLGIQHSQDSCLKESLLKQDRLQRHLLGVVDRRIAEKLSWFKKRVILFGAFWSSYYFLMFCDATKCIVFFPGYQVLKCSRIRPFARVGLRRKSYRF